MSSAVPQSRSLLKLLQLTSPSLPVGSYSYSQGLEWGVECGWVGNATDFRRWLGEQLDGTMAQQDLAILKRLYHACEQADDEQTRLWDAILLAMRETSELRHEEHQRARALDSLMDKLQINRAVKTQSQVAAFACFCVHENIAVKEALHGYAYSWLDSQVTAGIKLIPLGQSDGQLLLYEMGDDIERAVEQAMVLQDDQLGYSSPALAMASSLHETQYCRLFRS